MSVVVALVIFLMPVSASTTTTTWTSGGPDSAYINDLAVHPTSSDTVFAAVSGEDQHLAKTPNRGASWEYLLDSPTDLTAVAIDPTNPSRIFVGDSKYSYLTWDGGQEWSRQLKAFCEVTDFWLKPNSLIVVIATTHNKEREYGVWRNFRWGDYNAWENTLHHRCLTLAGDPNHPNVVYVGTKAWGYVGRSAASGARDSWYGISPSGKWVGEVRDIEVDLNSDVYAATDEGLRKWDGSDWTELTGLPTDNITALAIDRSTNPGVLYVGTGGNGVFVSEDGGNTWVEFNDGLENLSINVLAISDSEPKMIYAGTAGDGVWSRAVITSLEEGIKGDVNNDGKIRANDALLALRIAVGLIEPTDYQKWAADVNCDGRVRSNDALIILQYAVGQITQFPCDVQGASVVTAKNENQLLIDIITELENSPLTTEQKGILEQLKQLIWQQLLPNHTILLQNYPNPFNPETWISFLLAQDAPVTIHIYNTKGQLVRTIALGNKQVGVYTTKDRAAYWDGRCRNGEKVASGVYYYTLQAGDFSATRKMVILK